jgi:HK97 family phage major capsid protein
MHDYLRRLISEREAITATLSQMSERATAEDRDYTEAEHSAAHQLQERAASIDGQLEEQTNVLQSVRSFANLTARLGELSADDVAPARSGSELATRDASGALETRSIGQAAEELSQDERFRAWLADGARGTSPRQIAGSALATRAATDPIMSSGAGGVGDLGPRYTVEVTYPTVPMLLSVVSREVVNTNVVEFITWTPATMPAAAKVAEGTLKPAVDVIPNTTSASLDTYAGWKAITRQALEDYPRIRTIVESKLRESLQRAVSDAVATGMDSAVAATAGGPDLSSAIRAAIGELHGKGYNPNAVALNPADWAAIDIGGQSTFSPGGFWGLTPVSSPDITPGAPIVGDFKSAITVFDRGQTDVFVTDSHDDYFLKNILVVLAEGRFLVTVVDPSAMAKTLVVTGP